MNDLFHMFLSKFPWIVLHVAAAICMLLWLSTRLMGHVHSVRLKHPLMYLLAVLLSGIGLFSGMFAGGTPWTALPILTLVAAAAFEVRHAGFRRRHLVAPVSAPSPLGLIRRPVGPVRPQVIHHRIDMPSWPGTRFSVLHVSDLHIDRWFPEEWFAETVRALADLKPDLVFLSGDAINREQDIPRAASILKPLASLAPSFAVLGNHDFWVDAEGVSAGLRKAGFDVLRNETREVAAGGSRILVSGSEYPWNAIPWQAPARRDLPLLVIAHTADAFPRYRAAGAVALFSGHYHAGQVRLPLIGPLLMPSINGRRFDHGHFLVGGIHLLISAGLGTEYPPMRVLCTPDVFHIEFRGAMGMANTPPTADTGRDGAVTGVEAEAS